MPGLSGRLPRQFALNADDIAVVERSEPWVVGDELAAVLVDYGRVAIPKRTRYFALLGRQIGGFRLIDDEAQNGMKFSKAAPILGIGINRFEPLENEEVGRGHALIVTIWYPTRSLPACSYSSKERAFGRVL